MLADIKLLLDIPLNDNTKDQILNSLYRIMQQRVKNYCNIAEIPDALDFTVSEMTVAYYKQNYGASTMSVGAVDDNGNAVAVGAIKSESLGDYSVTYDTGSDSSSDSSAGTEGILADYTSQLNMFRHLRL